GYLIDALLGDLRDMQQPVTSGQDLHDRAEVEQPDHLAFVNLADFDFGGDLLDPLARRVAGVGIDRGDRHRAVVLDVDRSPRLFGQRADDRAALADDVADLLGVDLEGHHPRRVLRDLGARVRQGFLHQVQDVHAPLARLRQRHGHDFLGDALDLDVHLQGGNAAVGAGDLEVHIAQVILVAEDVREHGEAVAFLDQTHRDPRN